MTDIAVTARSFRHAPGRHHEMLAELGFRARYPESDGPLAAAELGEVLSGCAGAIVGLDQVDADVLALPGLRIIVRFGSGTDNVDLEAARRLGVLVAATPGANAVSVAELALSLMLGLARQVTVMDRMVRSGSWQRPVAMELQGRRLGIVGAGSVGLEVARRARCLGMDVVAYDSREVAASGLTMVPFGELLDSADVISIHCPLTEQTAGLFSAQVLRRMKPGALLVNTARGGIVDEAALAEVLTDGHLAGAALDCFATEPLTASRLMDIGNVILTPHAGAATREAAERAGLIAVGEIARALSGQDLEHRVS
jgi:phosphoglycerate dehydrogenase-like enzyme